MMYSTESQSTNSFIAFPVICDDKLCDSTDRRVITDSTYRQAVHFTKLNICIYCTNVPFTLFVLILELKISDKIKIRNLCIRKKQEKSRFHLSP